MANRWTGWRKSATNSIRGDESFAKKSANARFPQRFQFETHAGYLHAPEKLDGFEISHRGNFVDYRSTVKVMS
jgi:hypothetical protein